METIMVQASFVQTERILEVATPLGETLVINGFSGTEAISGLFRFKLDLLANSSVKIDMKKLLGKAVR